MTLKRVERALADLKSAGLITVSPRCEKQSDGTFKGLAAVKAVSKELFGAFDLGEKLRAERERARKRVSKKMSKAAREQENKKEPATRTQKARLSLCLHGLGGAVVKKPYKQKPFYSGGAPPDNTEYRKQLMLTAFSLRQANPEWSIDKAYEEAEKQLLGPRSRQG
jgi:hypothetical protein